MTKVIYQYVPLTLTLQGYSVGGTVAGTFGTDTIEINRGKNQGKTAFSFTTTAGATAAYRILKQPVAGDVLAFIEPVVGSAPIDLPGEDIYPTVSNTDTVNGVVSSGGSAPYTVTMDTAVASKVTVGDRITGNTALDAKVVTVVALTGTYTFTMSEDIAIADPTTLSFSNRMNYSWPINNFVDKLKEDMIVVPGTSVTTDTTVSKYEDSITIFEGTKEEEKIIKNVRPALDTLGKKPTVVEGLITTQAGAVVFDKQQVLALAGITLKVGGYGVDEILRVYGWKVKFTDLAIALTAPTTTTTETTSAHATIAVADKEGVINSVSRVGGIGINSKLQNPLITSGGGADGAGDWTLSTPQSFENGVTLTVLNTSRVATITGEIEVLKSGIADVSLRFDLEKILTAV